MSPNEKLDLARKAAELLVERSEHLAAGSAWDGDFRQELERQLLAPPPEGGRPGVEVLEQAAEQILRYSARVDHPRFFGFVPSAPSWPSVVADFMVAGYHINQASWLSASGPSQVELDVIDWIRQWFGYPDSAGGLFTSGGSAASLNAFVAALEAVSRFAREEWGG